MDGDTSTQGNIDPNASFNDAMASLNNNPPAVDSSGDSTGLASLGISLPSFSGIFSSVPVWVWIIVGAAVFVRIAKH
jgi:hypothetical protein